MSADKNRAERRAHNMLLLAAEMGGRLMLNHEGGYAANAPALLYGLARGWFTTWRGFSDGTTTFRQGTRIKHGDTPRTFAIVSEEGFALLAALPESRENKRLRRRW